MSYAAWEIEREVPWSAFAARLAAETTSRLAYLDGILEPLRMPARAHADAAFLARLIEVYAEEHDLCLNALGSAPFGSEVARAGISAEASYCIGGVSDAAPDLVLHVERPTAEVDHLEVYRRLGVAEVWMWTGSRLEIYSLHRERFTRVGVSRLVPADAESVAKLVTPENHARQTDVIRSFRKTLRRRR